MLFRTLYLHSSTRGPYFVQQSTLDHMGNKSCFALLYAVRNAAGEKNIIERGIPFRAVAASHRFPARSSPGCCGDGVDAVSSSSKREHGASSGSAMECLCGVQVDVLV